jgi:hypothetical protein
VAETIALAAGVATVVVVVDPAVPSAIIQAAGFRSIATTSSTATDLTSAFGAPLSNCSKSIYSWVAMQPAVETGLPRRPSSSTQNITFVS